MLRRAMSPGGVILLAILAVLAVQAAEGMVQPFNTIDYLRTSQTNKDYDSRPCMLNNPYRVCPQRGYCSSLNETHFSCDCWTHEGKPNCIGTYPDPCKLGPCTNGFCVPEGGFSARYTCQCPPGYYGNLCQKGPITECAYHVTGIVPEFATYFPSAERTEGEFVGLKDMCHGSGLVLIKNPRDKCLRHFYSTVSNALGDRKGFVYLGYDGPLYVSIHREFPISYTYTADFSQLIEEQKETGFSIIQICMQPPNIDGLLVIPQIVNYNRVNVACELLGLRSYRPFVNDMDDMIPKVSKALKYMSETYYNGQTMFYGIQVEADSNHQEFYKFSPSLSEEISVIPSIPKEVESAVSICRVLDPCDMDPCGPNAWACRTTNWGFKCMCKNGFTGRLCSQDMAAYRVTCGTYTMYTLANTAVFKNQVRSIGVVSDTCKAQSASPPPKPMSQCEREFYRNVSQRFFNSHSFMYYTTRDQEMAFATNAPHISYAFTDRFKFHPQAVICHGSKSLETFASWYNMNAYEGNNFDNMLLQLYNPCEHALLSGCSGRGRFYG